MKHFTTYKTLLISWNGINGGPIKWWKRNENLWGVYTHNWPVKTQKNRMARIFHAIWFSANIEPIDFELLVSPLCVCFLFRRMWLNSFILLTWARDKTQIDDIMSTKGKRVYTHNRLVFMWCVFHHQKVIINKMYVIARIECALKMRYVRTL